MQDSLLPPDYQASLSMETFKIKKTGVADLMDEIVINTVRRY